MTPTGSQPDLPPSHAARFRVLIVAVIAAAVIGPILVIFFLLNPFAGPRATVVVPTQPARSVPRTKPSAAPSRPTSRPSASRPASSPSVGAALETDEPRLAFAVGSMETSIFAIRPQPASPGSVGLLPAPPDQLYLLTTIVIEYEGADSLTLRIGPAAPHDASVTLMPETGDRIPTLGRLGETPDRLRPYDAAELQLDKRNPTARLRLAFLIPESLRSTDLVVADLPPHPLQIPPRETAATRRPLAGTWIKAPQQAWALRYQNPILDEIRADHHTRLRITDRPAGLEFEFPLIDVSAIAKPHPGDVPGYYDLILQSDDRTLPILARFADDVLILYFRAETAAACVYVRP